MGTDQSGGDGSTYLGVGFLTATASDDWTLVLELCERASASESAAKEAAKALKQEFKCVDDRSTELSLTDWELDMQTRLHS